MKKRLYFLFLLLILGMFLITAALVNKNTNKWESSDDISFSITGFDGNLTGAIENDLFRTPISSILDSSATNERHNLSEIWVSVDNIGMNFKNAIENTDLCGLTDVTLNYSNAPDPSHLGTEIEISTDKSLQDAINDGTLVSTPGNWSGTLADSIGGGGCSATCGGGTQTRTCTNPSLFCGGTDCSDIDGGSDTRICNSQPCCPSGTTEINGDCYGSWQPNNWCGSSLCEKDSCLHGSPEAGGWSGSRNDFEIFTCYSTDITDQLVSSLDGYCIDAAQIQSGVSCSGPNNGYCYRKVYCR